FLHQNDQRHINLKQVGHLYLTDGYLLVKNFIKTEYDTTLEKYGPKRCKKVTDMIYKGYTSVDVIENGVYDAHDPHILELVQENAEIIGCPYCHVPGSNLILEKLLAGQWDDQFLVVEKGQPMEMEKFL
ncbi:MAG: DUF1638 domain-containing protein, partial [Clostridiales bacterium]